MRMLIDAWAVKTPSVPDVLRSRNSSYHICEQSNLQQDCCYEFSLKFILNTCIIIHKSHPLELQQEKGNLKNSNPTTEKKKKIRNT